MTYMAQQQQKIEKLMSTGRQMNFLENYLKWKNKIEVCQITFLYRKFRRKKNSIRSDQIFYIFFGLLSNNNLTKEEKKKKFISFNPKK